MEHDVLYDYSVRFEDRQSLQLRRRKLLKAATILQAAIDLGYMMKRRFEKSDLFNGDMPDVLLIELEDYVAEATYYKRCLDDLLRRSLDTNDLVWKVSLLFDCQKADVPPSFLIFWNTVLA